METLNMMQVNVDEFIRMIKNDLEENIYTPVIGIGKSGIGKTVSIYELTQELGIGFKELRLVTLSETDLLGVPITVDANTGAQVKASDAANIQDIRTTYASNDLLPNEKRDGEVGLLVLDELTSANSTVRAAAYQLLDSKRALGNYKLPDKWKCIGLGNGPDDGGVFNGIEAATLSRALCLRVEPNLKTWKKWAVKHDVNASVMAYLTQSPDKLHEFNPDELACVFPCPRSWTALSDRLNAREKRKGGMLDEYDVELYAAAAVGVKTASSFAAFYQYNSQTIDPELIMAGKATPDVIRSANAEVVYLLIQNLVKIANEELNKGDLGNMEFTPECVQRLVNLSHWAVGVANEVNLDYGYSLIQDLASGSPLFGQMVLANNEFNDKCPELTQLGVQHQIVFNAGNK